MNSNEAAGVSPLLRFAETRPVRPLASLRDLVTEPDPDDELDWQTDALCAQVDPELFFPDKGGTSLPAKAVCARCGVRERCLDYALENGERFGIWGGLSERQRRRILAPVIAPDDDEHDDDEDAPEPLTMLCAAGGLLAAASIPLTTAQTYAAKGLFIDPCETNRRGVRLYRPSDVAEWLDTRRTRARQEAS